MSPGTFLWWILASIGIGLIAEPIFRQGRHSLRNMRKARRRYRRNARPFVGEHVDDDV